MRINEAAMEVDERIVELGAKLDEWLDGNLTTLAFQDRRTQAKALLRGFDIVKEFDRVKADGLKAITALLNHHDHVTADRRAASLIRGFEFAAKLAHSLHDELLDTDGESKVLRLMDTIVQAFGQDRFGPRGAGPRAQPSRRWGPCFGCDVLDRFDARTRSI
jgi:hypothetical protein